MPNSIPTSTPAGSPMCSTKGENPEIDSYSAFRDNDRTASTGLSTYLRSKGVTEIELCGLATDYSREVLGARCRGPSAGRQGALYRRCEPRYRPAGVEAAIAEMKAAGVEIVT